GHGISVKRDRPVDVLKARNCRPAGDSESKSMISRWKSSTLAAAGLAALANANVVAGGGLAIGSNPRFLSTHLRSTRMATPPLGVAPRQCTTIAKKNNG